MRGFDKKHTVADQSYRLAEESYRKSRTASGDEGHHVGLPVLGADGGDQPLAGNLGFAPDLSDTAGASDG